MSEQGELVTANLSTGNLSTGNLVTMGEVHTGLLHHSSAVSAAMAARLLDVVLGERVRRSDRPISYVLSPSWPTGVDCLLPAAGAKIRGVGTVVSRAAITGGHVLQGSAFVQVRRSQQARRLPWSHYLARPGIVETLGKADGRHIATGFLEGKSSTEHLDLGAVSRRAVDAVQDRLDLDHRAAFRTARTKLRWVVGPADVDQRSVVFGVLNETIRTVRLPSQGLDVTAVAELCEDLALHDWLLTTLLSLIERSRVGSGSRAETIDRLQPAIDFLLHLWMPAARTDEALLDVWKGVEQRPGFSRQWQVNVDRVRDQLALGTMEKLGVRSSGS
jgi:hypothetical protein